jgi:hypothetical protein
MGIDAMKIFHRYWYAVLIGYSLAACAMQSDKKDVDAFVAKREICDHLRGEFPDPPDAQRTQEIIEGTRKYCKGTDVELRTLKARYGKDAATMTLLSSFEESIE